jgi:hypothetical protein
MLDNFLKALPLVARHPFSFLGYVALLAVWLITTIQIQKANKLFGALQALPEGQRLQAIQLEYRTTPREGLSAQEWLESRKMTYVFAAFGSTLFSALVVCAFAISRSTTRNVQNNGRTLKIESITGNVFISYADEKVHAAKAVQASETVRFVTEDVTFESGLSHPLSPYLVIRFTIYNDTSDKIKIFNFHTVQYSARQSVYYCGGPRCYLEISPEKPFLERDETFEIVPRENSSFKLRYKLDIGGGEIQTVLGVVAYYHTQKAETCRVVSDKLCLTNPSRRKIMLFTDKTAPSILKTDSSESFSHGWVKQAAEGELAHLREIWRRHVSAAADNDNDA